MPTITGTYYKGRLKLDKPVKFSKPVKVTVSFEEEISEVLTLSDFSFMETQELLKDCKTSFSDEVIEERRNAV
jgi:predicted DNA-binding antitoxin AbrB/MazE fold protein